MANMIRIRDVVRKATYELGSEQPILRGSYNLFHPDGPVKRNGDLVQWQEDDNVLTSRVVPARLGEVHPGERVLVHFGSDDDWWLCDVEAVDGAEGNT